MVSLEKYGHTIPLLDTARIPHDLSAHVFVSIKEELYLHNMVRRAASVMKMSRYKMFEEQDAVKDMRKHREKMLHQCIRNVYYMQKKAGLEDTGSAILVWLADPMQFPKKLLEKPDFLGTSRKFRYMRLSNGCI